MAAPNSPKPAQGQPLASGFAGIHPQATQGASFRPGGPPSGSGGARAGGQAAANEDQQLWPVVVANARTPLRPDPAVDGESGLVESSAEDLKTLALKSAPPWLVSAVFHMAVMIVLALVLLPSLVSNQIELEAVYAERLGEQLEFDSPIAGNDLEAIEEPILTPDDLIAVDNPFAAAPQLEVDVLGATSSHLLDAPAIGVALDGREPGMKKSLLAAYGGTALTEKAVADGLKWLAKNQQKDGSWSLVGPYSDGGTVENREAATAMALLAFQGDGHTTERGEHQNVVERGWYYLLKQQDGEGCFFREGNFGHRFYTHAQATIAICELFAMTRDPQLRASYRDPAERAIAYCLKTQSPAGGWKYTPGGPSDVSVTGWVVMALQSGRMAGIEVPQANLDKISGYLDRVAQSSGSRYPYELGREATKAMTAEALLCRQYLGWKRNHGSLVEGVNWLLQPKNLLDYRDRDVYYWYYATQVMHHMEGDSWNKWNAVMRQVIPENQVKEGKEFGSWDPLRPTEDAWGRFGGRLYVTCLSIYMLEVYYRHLPLYSNVYMSLQ